MKKIYVVLSCVLSLYLVSCASQNIPSDISSTETPEVNFLEQPEESNSDDNISENLDPNESTDTTIEIEESEEVVSDNKIQLDEIIEPVVITLEPAEEVTYDDSQTDEIQDEQNDIEETQEEQIEIELPPELPEANQEIDTSVSDENELEEFSDNTDDIVDVIDDVEDVIETFDSNSDDIIDITDENDAVSDEESIDEELILNNDEEPVEIIPSRSVTLKKQEYLDISYPGTGWVYMGITDGSKDLSYFGRKLGTADTKFTLQAKVTGTKLLHFYRNDALTNQYIDDYIEVTILPEKGSNKTHIEAPAYTQPVPKKAKEIFVPKNNSDKTLDENKSVASETDISTAFSSTKENNEVIKEISDDNININDSETLKDVESDSKAIEQPDTNVLLKEIYILYNEKEYKAALDKLDIFFEYSTSDRDEALFLQGQIYEAKSETQNIKAAMDSYTSLIKNYPASKYWDDANKRIKYLKRFYFGG